jgi:hypothetical protein
MRFWELVSVFGSTGHILREVLGRPEWAATYGAALEQFGDLVRRQDRRVLDAPVPVELSRALARLDHRTWSLDPEGWLRQRSTGVPGEKVITTLDVHDRFGGAVLEEVLEFGSFNVRSRSTG